MSLTDLHKGTHNCAAAIRESGAGISPSPASSPAPLVVHPVVHPQAPVRSLSLSYSLALSFSPSLSVSRVRGGGDRARALSQCSAIIFPHEWAAVSVVPALVLRYSRCIFYPLPPSSPFPPSSFLLPLFIYFSLFVSLLFSFFLSALLRSFSFNVLRIRSKVQNAAQDSRRVFFFNSKMILFREKVSSSLHIAQITDGNLSSPATMACATSPARISFSFASAIIKIEQMFLVSSCLPFSEICRI